VSDRGERAARLASLASAFDSWLRSHHKIVDDALADRIGLVKAKAHALERRLASAKKTLEDEQAAVRKVCLALRRLLNRNQ
jgi:hypothetical protein